MRLALYLTSLLIFVSACGNNDQKEKESSSNEIRTIEIYGLDQMKYAVKDQGETLGTGEMVESAGGNSYRLLKDIKAEPGELIRIKLTAATNLPPESMSHNWILLKPEADPDAFAKAAIQAKDQNYIPGDRTDNIIARTDLASGGKTVEITFTVPDQKGSYDYLCSFPGHYTAGMTGKLIVE